MEVNYVILARYAEFTTEGTMTIVGGDHVRHIAEGFPSVIQELRAAVRVTLDRADTETDHSIQCVVVPLGADEPIAEMPVGTIPRSIDAIVGQEENIAVAMVLTIPFVVIPQAGKYEFRLMLDGVRRGGSIFRVALESDYRQLNKLPEFALYPTEGSHESS